MKPGFARGARDGRRARRASCVWPAPTWARLGAWATWGLGLLAVAAAVGFVRALVGEPFAEGAFGATQAAVPFQQFGVAFAYGATGAGVCAGVFEFGRFTQATGCGRAGQGDNSKKSDYDLFHDFSSGVRTII